MWYNSLRLQVLFHVKKSPPERAPCFQRRYFLLLSNTEPRKCDVGQSELVYVWMTSACTNQSLTKWILLSYYYCHIKIPAYQYQTGATTLFLMMFSLELLKEIQYIKLKNNFNGHKKQVKTNSTGPFIKYANKLLLFLFELSLHNLQLLPLFDLMDQKSWLYSPYFDFSKCIIKEKLPLLVLFSHPWPEYYLQSCDHLIKCFKPQ